ncbi:two-component response regulator ARR1 [Selaginella moellendorffii]|uniref:two-component response regulator ARR1-like n=1 Tax=Selaginella moellendorffii TaxID=88036 RepID=UPI000D1CEF76|nr:two-component response regulator ARR1-like [Selaginella moellendorffii]XP_024534075.1 two-component response regulator ARR1 [Selaginella moellendorffii]|eukprot:XP_024525426.1 two-component response regulator ARR1-like [Selaginella moellendorffii]
MAAAVKENDRVEEWEEGLPTPEELTPLNQSLITPELASAFSISQEAAKSSSDVLHASIATVTALRRQPSSSPGGVFESIPAFPVAAEEEIDKNAAAGNGIGGFADAGAGAGAGAGAAANSSLQPGQAGNSFQFQGTQGFDPARRGEVGVASAPMMSNLPYSPYERRPETSSGGGMGAEDSSNTAKKLRKQSSDLGEEEEADSGGGPENSGEEPAARTLKRPRLVWTPQLHKRFVDAVAHLGIKNAVPKTIMQLMNVEGLTRENVASHLQKYRLYLKRMQGLSSEGPSASDHLFASTPVPPGLAAAAAHFIPGHRDDVVALPFSPVVPVPIAGLGAPHVGAAFGPRPPYSGFEHHPYGTLGRSVPQRMGGGPGDHREMVMENQGQPGSSPPRRILTLFPTSSH